MDLTPAWDGMACMAGQGMVCCEMPHWSLGRAWQGMVWGGMPRHGLLQQARRGMARHGMAWHDIACSCAAAARRRTTCGSLACVQTGCLFAPLAPSCAGYPFDVPAEGANLLSYCALSYHLPLVVPFSVKVRRAVLRYVPCCAALCCAMPCIACAAMDGVAEHKSAN